MVETEELAADFKANRWQRVAVAGSGVSAGVADLARFTGVGVGESAGRDGFAGCCRSAFQTIRGNEQDCPDEDPVGVDDAVGAHKRQSASYDSARRWN